MHRRAGGRKKSKRQCIAQRRRVGLQGDALDVPEPPICPVGNLNVQLIGRVERAKRLVEVLGDGPGDLLEVLVGYESEGDGRSHGRRDDCRA